MAGIEDRLMDDPKCGRKSGPSHHLVIAVGLLLAAGIVALVLINRLPVRAANPPKQAPQAFVFSGLVLDQDGQPVAGAEVLAVACELAPNFMSGSPIINRRTERTIEVATDERGYFSLTVPAGYQILEINDVRKPGYEWVHDWGWGKFPYTDPKLRRTNRYFNFEGEHNKGVPYRFDPERLPVYPMHEIGNPSPQLLPARGGRDAHYRNDPKPLLIPSAGPGAPRTHQEIEQRIRELPTYQELLRQEEQH